MLAAYPVTLYRNSPLIAWGFRLQGGADLHTPIMVQRVFAGSPAEGQLQRGDILIGIENYDATCLLNTEAQELVRASGTSLSLNVKRTQGGRLLRGQSVGPMSRQQLAPVNSVALRNQNQQPLHHQQQQQQAQQMARHPNFWRPGTEQQLHDQYNVYVNRSTAVPQRQRSESTSHIDSWQQQQQQQQRHLQKPRQQQQQQQQQQQLHQPIFAQQPQHPEEAQQHYQSYSQRDFGMDSNPYPEEDQMQHHQQQQRPSTNIGSLGPQRSMDDDEIDYSFTRQSVAERSRAFMAGQQPASQHRTVGYHSVPRTNYSTASSAPPAGRYRQQTPRPRSTLDSYGGSGPLGEFGWSPSAEKLRQARRQPGQPASRAAFEQSSYLPSRGIGRTDSPTTLGVGSRSAGRTQQRHSVSGGGGVGGYYPASRGGPRYVSSSTGSADESSNNINNNHGNSRSDNGADPFTVYNSRQYNTPINMYSRQNVATAFEGQTGMRVESQRQQQALNAPPPGRQINSVSGHSVGPGVQPISQSQVYKMVHEQEDPQQQRRRAAGGHQEPYWVASSSSRRRDSEKNEELGVSEF